ncbi:hypothetical protein [Vibrio alfacsensis]|uniref:hypothetical protein n=1 Tax=Vibrio alfacsensis TaxID=1074311 RepID=UPI001BEE99A0|nr:hypothetical protein [Vibrio alfacsensis]BCN24306.1 hypothetical protein VYA_14980 [Vibrio alfacsensis]
MNGGIAFPTIIICSFLLAGCGNDGDETNTTSPPLSVQDGFISAGVGTSVDLSPYIDGNQPSITAIVASQDLSAGGMQDCPELVASDLSVQVEQESGIFCQYQYTVEDAHQQTATAKLNLFSSSSLAPTLPELSYAATLNESVYMNFAEVLGEQFPDGFRVRQGTPAMIGDPNNLGRAATDNEKINFIAPASPGWTRVLYILESEVDTSNTKLGSIYFTFTEQGSEAPEITPAHYDYNAQMSTTVEAMQSLTLDLSALTGLTITDDQEWQLLAVSSLTAEVELLDKETVGNTSFRFEALSPGVHIVSFLVGDVNNNNSQGSIAITVIPKEQDKTWSEIVVDGANYNNIFTAPPRYSDVVGTLAVTPSWDPEVENTLASFTPEVAMRYCNQYGNVPTSQELARLWSRDHAGTTTGDRLSNWPKEHSYIARRMDGNFELMELDSSEVTPWVDGKKAYLTCIRHHDLSLDMVVQTGIANGQNIKVALVQGVSPENNYELEAIAIDSDDVVPFVNLEQVMINPNQFSVLVNSTRATEFRIRVTNQEDSNETATSLGVTLLGDAETARLSYHFSKVDPEAAGQPGVGGETEYKLIADELDELVATLVITDENGNPVPDVRLVYESNTATILVDTAPETMLTNDVGEVNVDIRATAASVGSEYELLRSIWINLNNERNVVAFPIVSSSFYDTLGLSDLNISGLVKYATLKIVDYRGRPKRGIVRQRLAGRDGLILHVVGLEVTPTDIAVPESGVQVFLASHLKNSVVETRFEVSSSPNYAMLSLDTSLIPRKKSATTTGKLGQYDAVRERFVGIDSLCVTRSRGNDSGYLPNLTSADVGKTYIQFNSGTNLWTNMYRESDGKEIRVSTNAQRTFYWTGTVWVMQNNSAAAIFDSCAEFLKL